MEQTPTFTNSVGVSAWFSIAGDCEQVLFSLGQAVRSTRAIQSAGCPEKPWEPVHSDEL